MNQINAYYYVKACIFSSILVLLVSCGGGGDQADDPTVDARALAYVKRPVPVDMNGAPISNDYRDPTSFNPGANIYLKSNATLSASELNITESVLGTTGDVKDLEFSSDGSKLVFSMRLEDPDPNDMIEMTWDIYTYDMATGVITPVISSPVQRRLGNDVMPHFVPDGNDPAARIIFSSDRGVGVGRTLNNEGLPSFKPITDDRGRNEYAFNLHIINTDGSGLIEQITYNMSNDFDPTVLPDGRIMFVRQDDARSGPDFNSNGRFSLYTMHPDGTNIQRLYGFDSPMTGSNGTFAIPTSPRLMDDGRVAVILRDFTDTFDGGDVVVIDTTTYIDNTIPLDLNSGMTGPAQISASSSNVLTNAGISSGGRYASVVPLHDGTGRGVVSYSTCFAEVTNPDNSVEIRSCGLIPDLSAPNIAVAPPRYGIYMSDLFGGTVRLIRNAEAGYYYTDVAVAQDLNSPDVLPDITANAGLTAGILNIRSVYDVDGQFNDLGGPAAGTFGELMRTSTPEERRPWFIRILKGTYFPNDDDIANFDFDTAGFGQGRGDIANINYMREIIGYAQVHPDGSVRVQVPANVPLTFEIVDANARRLDIPSAGREYTHPTWIVVRPDAEVKCHGCHLPSSPRSHARDTSSVVPLSGVGANGVGQFVDDQAVGYNGVVQVPAVPGETMAETRTRINVLSLPVSMDLAYDDAWTNSGNAFRLEYDNLPSRDPLRINPVIASLASPANAKCSDIFDPDCRIIYNYERHIHPIWEVTRTDINGMDKTCIGCHSPFNAVQDVPQGQYQLDLTSDHGGGVDTLRNTDYYASYNELFLNDDIVESSGNVLIDSQFATDCNGNTIVDGNGNPVMGTRTVFCDGAFIMRRGSARRSTLFFNKFTTLDPGDDRHCVPDGMGGCESILTPEELWVISEYLDNGGQYVNNPFASPQ